VYKLKQRRLENVTSFYGKNCEDTTKTGHTLPRQVNPALNAGTGHSAPSM